MRHLLAAVVALIVALPAYGGEPIIVENFSEGQPSRVVLQNIKIKSVVAEFLDPGDTGDGKSVAALLWREVLSAISDQAQAGAILASAPAGERLTDMLSATYHHAAEKIARYEQARLALWGAISTEAGETTVETYLTVIGSNAAASLSLNLDATFGRESIGKFAFEAPIGRTKFNFEPNSVRRSELFARTLITNHVVSLRRAPRASSGEITKVSPGATLRATDMTDGWFLVQVPNGAGKAYVLGDQNIDITPRCIRSDTTIKLRDTPSGPAKTLLPQSLSECLSVTGMRYLRGSGLWYEVAADGRQGWLRADEVHAGYSLPIVHFVAGLYRFYLHRYPEAAEQFRQFLYSAGSFESNANIAAVEQLLAASLAMEGRSDVLKPLARAIALTPFDPNAYLVRAVVDLGASRSGSDILADIRNAFVLDPESVVGRNLLGLLLAIAYKPAGERGIALRRWWQEKNLSGNEMAVIALAREYGVTPVLQR